MARCYEGHKPMQVDVKGILYELHGGNCNNPVKGATVIVALDRSWNSHPMALPWNDGTAFQFLIPDMNVPANPKSFKAMIEFLAKSVVKDEVVFIGCIGGHGRTGMVLAALVAYLTDEEKPIAYVRERYCESAVETQSQVDWLAKHFNCEAEAPASKGMGSGSIGGKASGSWWKSPCDAFGFYEEAQVDGVFSCAKGTVMSLLKAINGKKAKKKAKV